MRTLKVLGCGLVALFAVAPGASAQTQAVTGVTTSSLSLSIPGPVTGAILTPGQTANFTPTLVGVVAPDAAVTPWALQVQDATNGGKLQKTADPLCITASAAEIADPLDFTASTAIESGGGSSGSVGTTDALVADGSSLTDTVTVNYSVEVPSGIQLAAACPYNTTLTYTLTG